MKRKTKSRITYGIAILFIIAIVFFLRSVPQNDVAPSAYSASALSLVETSHDFGTINMKDGNVRYRFEVKNEGEEMVNINEVFTSCMCTTVELFDASNEKRGSFGMPGHGVSKETSVNIASGESAFMDVIYDPAAHGPSGVGLVRRSVYIGTNSSLKPKLELTIKAMVTR